MSKLSKLRDQPEFSRSQTKFQCVCMPTGTGPIPAHPTGEIAKITKPNVNAYRRHTRRDKFDGAVSIVTIISLAHAGSTGALNVVTFPASRGFLVLKEQVAKTKKRLATPDFDEVLASRVPKLSLNFTAGRCSSADSY